MKKSKPKVKPGAKVSPKTKAKPKGKVKPKPAVRAAAARSKPKKALARPAGSFATTVGFPVPGGQDCYVVPPAVSATTFTASITTLQNVTVTTVRLTIGNNAPILADQINAQGNNLFYAVFSGVTLANGALTPNTACVLVVETSDQTSVGFFFSHVPQPPQISVSSAVNPAAANSLTVTVTTTNIDLATVSVTGINGSAPDFTTPTSSPFTFTFDATSASPQPGVSISAKDAEDHETLTFVFDLNADFTPPTFEDGPTGSAEDDSFIISGEIIDLPGTNSPASGINAAASPSPLTIVSITDPGGATLTSDEFTVTLTQTSSVAAAYEIVIPNPKAGTYALTMTATDISGNTSASQSWPLVYTAPS
jgi:hypothetical protein